MNVLLIDNNDSFTFNLVQMLKEAGSSPVIKKCNEISSTELSDYKKIMISPGPGLPSKELLSLIRECYKQVSLLGICLGQQAISMIFGSKLKPSLKIYHGEAVETYQIKNNYSLFSGLPEKFMTGRYHSWVIDPDTFSSELEITAIDANGEIMGICHKDLKIDAVQFHPESILTPHGEIIIQNWLGL